MSATDFRRSVRAAMRERALDVAERVTAEQGWGAMRMTAVADEVGVSRQTLYAEFGSREALAGALVERELSRILAAVDTAMRGAGDDVAAVAAAVRTALVEADGSALVRGALRSPDPAGDLLRLLTTGATPLVDAATAHVCSALSRPDAVAAVEPVVRLTISHLLERPADRDAAAAGILAFAAPALRAAGLSG